jgi:type I restriction enzyme M protein
MTKPIYIDEGIIKETIDIGEKEGLFKVNAKKIEYTAVKKSYNFNDPEEKVRISFYLELIKKYQYPKERIDLEVIVPRREPSDKADIVVYEDDEKKKPYIVVECKKDGISQAEIKQAIEQAFGNANSLRAKYTILVAGNVRIAFDVANFSSAEREKNIIADIPVRYGKVVKFKYLKGDAQWDLKDVTRDELLAKFQQCHDTLWEGGKRNPAEAFDEMSKLMYCKIQDERFLTKKGEHYRFRVGTYETINEVAERIRKIYKEAQDIDPEVFVEVIKADNPVIYTVAEILQGISLARTDLDVKGEGYEHFLGGVFRGAMGQYFTPRPIVTFMVNFLEPTVNDIVVDPACGSGGFLIYTLEKMRKELYTKLDEKDAAYRWQDFALKQVYGIEINSQLARVSMMNMIIHEDGHTNIENADALDSPETWKRQKLREWFNKKFTLLLTNPPFGASVKEREKSYLAKYELGAKVKKRNRQNTEILFIERCLDFLKPGGRMGIVLPDGILTNSSLQYVRDFVTDRTQILGVVSLPQTAFKRPSSKGSGDTGSGVKASLLFLRKKKTGENLPKDYPIFMAISEHIGYDSTGRPDKDEFPDILKDWQEFKKTNRIDFFVKAPLCFAIGRGETEGRLDPYYYKKDFSELYSRLKKLSIKQLKSISYSITSGITPKSKGSAYAKKNEGIPFVRSGDLNEDNEINYENVVYIKKEIHESTMKYSQLLKDDLLIAIVGATIGQISLFKDNCQANINQAIARVRLKKDVNPSHVLYFMRSKLGQEQLNRLKRPVARANINLNEIGNILIPIPSTKIQDKIASIMDEVYKTKKEKESEAKRLLNSIETYISEILGIVIPTSDETSPKIFSVAADVLRGVRLDPFYYTPKFTFVDKALTQCKYPLKTIGDILSGSIVNGLDARKFVEKGTKYLRVGNIKPDEVDETDIKFLDIPLDDIKKDIKLKHNDVLLTRKGTFGISAVIEKDTDYIISSEIMRLRLCGEVNPYYFSIVNNTSILQQQYKQKAVGAIMGSLSQEVLKTVKIPIPPLSIQEIIVDEVNTRRKKAKELKKEARELLEKAKTKTEKLILGE